MKKISENILMQGNFIYTKNAVSGSKVYGEKIIVKDSVEFREWDPTRSKLGAAILNGLKDMPIEKGSRILYLGASTGTTVSHISDIIGDEGIVYSLEFAERVFRSLTTLAEKRMNIIPLLADVRKTESYQWIEEVDVVFCDISQPDETLIALRNAKEFLKEGGIMMIAIKSQSIDVTKKPSQVYNEEKAKIEKAGFAVMEMIDLEPYEDKHCIIVAKK